MKCPVCGKYDFEEHGDFDICPVCDWENDNLQYDDRNYAGGANHLSVNEARIEYFVMNHPKTADEAARAQQAYKSSVTEICGKYTGADRAAEQRRNALIACRQEYVDTLSGLMMSILAEI